MSYEDATYVEFVVSKSTQCLASTETLRFIRDGEKGREERGYGGGGKGRLYTYRYTVTTRMTCIKVGSDESHFNFHNCEGQVTRQCLRTDHNF